MDILVAYDISTLTPDGERRLARVAAICERYGIRTQYSVFECRVSAAGLQLLIGELSDVVDAREDSVNIYRFVTPIKEAKYSLGRSRDRDLGEPWVFGDSTRTLGDP